MKTFTLLLTLLSLNALAQIRVDLLVSEEQASFSRLYSLHSYKPELNEKYDAIISDLMDLIDGEDNYVSFTKSNFYLLSQDELKLNAIIKNLPSQNGKQRAVCTIELSKNLANFNRVRSFHQQIEDFFYTEFNKKYRYYLTKVYSKILGLEAKIEELSPANYFQNQPQVKVSMLLESSSEHPCHNFYRKRWWVSSRAEDVMKEANSLMRDYFKELRELDEEVRGLMSVLNRQKIKRT